MEARGYVILIVLSIVPYAPWLIAHLHILINFLLLLVLNMKSIHLSFKFIKLVLLNELKAKFIQ